MKTKVVGQSKIARLRAKKGIGVTLMAKLLAIPPSTLVDIECGSEIPSERLKETMAKLFTVSVEDLDDKITIVYNGKTQITFINEEVL